jgi:hypothetical protein
MSEQQTLEQKKQGLWSNLEISSGYYLWIAACIGYQGNNNIACLGCDCSLPLSIEI